MSSKFLWGVVVLSCLSFGCDRFLKAPEGADQNKETVKIEDKGLECLSSLSQRISLYTKDQLSEQQIEESFQCVNTALDDFSRLTRGAHPDRYSEDELRYFLNRYIVRGSKISPELMRQFMKVKLIVIGGSEGVINRDEIGQIKNFLHSVKKEVLSLRGYMQILLFQKKTELLLPSDELNLAVVQLSKTLKILISEVRLQGSIYEFSDFKALLEETRKFLGPDNGLEGFMKWVPLVESLKDFFIGKQASIRTIREWQDVASYGTDFYGLSLEYYYRLSKMDFVTNQDWSQLLDFTERGLSLVEGAPQLVKQGKFYTEDLDLVLDEVWKLNLISTDLPLTTLKNTYRMALLRVLDRNLGLSSLAIEATEINLKHLALLRTEFNVWKLNQQTLLTCFQASNKQAGLSQAELKVCLDQVDIVTEISKLKKSNLHQEELLQSWKDWRALLAQDRPLQWTNSMKIILDSNFKDIQSSLVGLSIQNAFSSVARLLLRGYGSGGFREVMKLKVSEKSLIQLGDDFKMMGEAIHFLDPRSVNPAGRTFKEANFFTLHGNGDNWLDSLELIEEISFLFSGGARMNNEMMRNASQSGCETGARDIFSHPILDQACYERTLRQNFSKLAEGMPGVAKSVSQLSDSGWSEMTKALLEIAALEQKTAGTLEMSEVRTELTVLEYVESLFVIYDSNKDGELTEAELLVALPRFQTFIASVSPVGNNFVSDIFLFLAYKGRKPSGVVELMAFKFEKQFGLGSIGRLQLIKVLAALKKDVSN